jgi:hypothetical protein
LDGAEGGGGVGELLLDSCDGFLAFGEGAAADDELVGGFLGCGEGLDCLETEAGVACGGVSLGVPWE